MFTVEDNGTGIPVDKMDNLFKMFYQVDTSLARKHGGTGLGLVICKGIIEDHGGKIWIDRSYTHGTSIKFVLPIASNDNL
jgi:signal transduction histidine kinase